MFVPAWNENVVGYFWLWHRNGVIDSISSCDSWFFKKKHDRWFQKPSLLQLFTNYSKDKERVQNIVKNKFLLFDPNIYNQGVYTTSIGCQLKGIPTESITQHYLVGDEGLTLHALLE